MNATDLPDLATSDQVRRYVLGELTGEELARFEQRLLAEADLQDEVEAEFALRAHAEVLVGQPSPQRVAPAKRWAVAASLVAGIGLGWIGARLPTPSLAPQAVEIVSFTVVRGAPGNALQASAQQPLVARFLTAADEVHQVEISDSQGRTLLSLSGLLPNAMGDIDVLLPPLPPHAGPLRVRLISQARTDEFELLLR